MSDLIPLQRNRLGNNCTDMPSPYVYVCVCVCVCVLCLYVHMPIQICTFPHTYTYAYWHTCTNAHIYDCTYMKQQKRLLCHSITVSNLDIPCIENCHDKFIERILRPLKQSNAFPFAFHLRYDNYANSTIFIFNKIIRAGYDTRSIF